MQLKKKKFSGVTVQTDNKMKNKPNRDAAQTNKVSWSHSTDNNMKNKPEMQHRQIKFSRVTVQTDNIMLNKTN